MKSILKIVVSFLIVIGIGIIGLVFADQQDFLTGRATTQTVIGTGGGYIENPLSLKEDIASMKSFLMVYIIGI